MSRSDEAWDRISAVLADGRAEVEVLPPGARAPVQTGESWLDAIAARSGGLRVDHGWLRVLGAGDPRLGDGLVEWNSVLGGQSLDPPLDDGLLVAYDAIGGFFVLGANGVRYRSSQDVEWSPMGFDYPTFLQWSVSGRLAVFAEASRWPGWEAEVKVLPPDHVVMFYPPLGYEGPRNAARQRSMVPAREMWTFVAALAKAPERFALRADSPRYIQ